MPTALEHSRPLILDGTDPSSLKSSVRERYGDGTARALQRMDVKTASTAGQKQLVEEVDQTHPSVDSGQLVNAYQEHSQQLNTKRDVLDKWYDAPKEAVSAEGEDRWYHKLGRGLKAGVMAPVRAVKWAFTKHPIISTVATTALGLYLAYQFGIPLVGFSGGGADSHTEGVSEAMRSLTNFAPGGDTVGVGGALTPNPSYGGIADAVIEGAEHIP